MISRKAAVLKEVCRNPGTGAARQVQHMVQLLQLIASSSEPVRFTKQRARIDPRTCFIASASRLVATAFLWRDAASSCRIQCCSAGSWAAMLISLSAPAASVVLSTGTQVTLGHRRARAYDWLSGMVSSLAGTKA